MTSKGVPTAIDCWPTIMAFALVAILTVPARGQCATSDDGARVRSPELVKTLTAAMTERGLTAIAAPDPQVPGQYVAAMLFPGVQLLVIRARSDASAYIDAEMAASRFENVYTALQQGVRDSKLFVQDMGCDGVHGRPESTPDIVYERGTDQHILNGDYKDAKMSREEYAKHVETFDRQYATLLQLLNGAVAKAPQR